MLNRIEPNDIKSVRLHLHGHFSGLDDCVYIMRWDAEGNYPDKVSFAEGLRNLNMQNWEAFRVREAFSHGIPTSNYWALEINFSNGAAICFASEDSTPADFELLLELMCVSWEDEHYYADSNAC